MTINFGSPTDPAGMLIAKGRREIRPRSITISALLFAALTWLPYTAAYADDDNDDNGCDHQLIHDFQFFEPDTQGHGRLCVRPRGLRGKLKLTELTPTHAYTVWWTYLDDPSQCGGVTPLPEDMTPDRRTKIDCHRVIP